MTTPNVNLFNRLALLGLMMLSIAFAAGCATEPETTPPAATPTPATVATPAAPTTTTPAVNPSPAASPAAAASPSPKAKSKGMK